MQAWRREGGAPNAWRRWNHEVIRTYHATMTTGNVRRPTTVETSVHRPSEPCKSVQKERPPVCVMPAMAEKAPCCLSMPEERWG